MCLLLIVTARIRLVARSCRGHPFQQIKKCYRIGRNKRLAARASIAPASCKSEMLLLHLLFVRRLATTVSFWLIWMSDSHDFCSDTWRGTLSIVFKCCLWLSSWLKAGKGMVASNHIEMLEILFAFELHSYRESQSVIHSVLHLIFNFTGFVIVCSSTITVERKSFPIVWKFATKQAANNSRMTLGDEAKTGGTRRGGGARLVDGHNQQNREENVTLMQVVKRGQSGGSTLFIWRDLDKSLISLCQSDIVPPPSQVSMTGLRLTNRTRT